MSAHEPQTPPPLSPDDHAREANRWAMLIHWSIVAGYVLPVFGLALPIVLWQLKKDEFPAVDAHGKVVANWLLSAILYALVSLALALVVIGKIGLLAIGVATLAFALIGGLKAERGELWEYPLSIRFLNPSERLP